MDRRKFVLSVGALAAGGGAAVGTGAFSSVEADRDLTVEVAGDANANLAVKPGDGPNGHYADTTSSDALALDFTSNNSNIGSGLSGGEGVNPHSVSEFRGVFEIVNQGTQRVEVDVSPLAFLKQNQSSGSFSALGVLLWPTLGSVELGPGDAQQYSVVIGSVELDGKPGISMSNQLQITAEAV